MKRGYLLILSGIVFLSANAQDKLTADPGKTQVLWSGEKVTGEHHGTINLKSGWLQWRDNKVQAGEFVIDMTSLEESENNQKFEGHMKSDDFFGVEKYPTAKFVVTESTTFEKGTGVVKGNLTIKEDTHPLELKAAVQKKEDGLWFYTTFPIDRTKYNVRFGSGTFFENLGDKTIYDDFKLRISLLLK